MKKFSLFVILMLVTVSSKALADCDSMGFPDDKEIQKAFASIRNNENFKKPNISVSDFTRGSMSVNGAAISFHVNEVREGKKYYTPFLGIMTFTEGDCHVLASYGISWEVK